MNAKTILHDTFRTGITMKGIDGLLEIIGGVLLWFVKPSQISGPMQLFFQHELSRDPHDFIAKHLLHMSVKLANSDPTFASLFLLSHGVVKVVLIIGLWLDKLWAYPATIVVFGAFSAYQMYRFTHTHSIFLVLLTIFDVFLIYLTWHEYEEQKRIRRKSPK
jgi:uncharacterized membrane protein